MFFIIFSLFLDSLKTDKPCLDSCQKSLENCYDPKDCSVEQYLLNPDYFVMLTKRDVSFSKYKLSEVERELYDVKEQSSSEWENLVYSLNHLKERREFVEGVSYATNEQLIDEFGNSINVFRYENITIRTEIIVESKEEILISNYGHTPDNNPIRDLEFDLTDDVSVLSDYLKKNRNDKMRDSIIYPSGCGAQCLVNYQSLYAIWHRVVKRLSVLIKQVFKSNLKRRPRSCRRKRKRIKRWFDNLMRPYPSYVYRSLLEYLRFILLSKVCDGNWLQTVIED